MINVKRREYNPRNLVFTSYSVDKSHDNSFEKELVIKLENKKWLVHVNYLIKDNKVIKPLEMFAYEKGTEFDDTSINPFEINTTICSAFNIFTNSGDYDTCRVNQYLTENLLNDEKHEKRLFFV